MIKQSLIEKGLSLQKVVEKQSRKLGIKKIKIFPMTNDIVETYIVSNGKKMHFQEFLIKYKMRPKVDKILFKNIKKSKPSIGLIKQILNSKILIFCPSNPIISINPILSVPGIKEAIIESNAIKIAINVSRSLNNVGLLAIEMFLTNDNRILINEIAPRPHNSGHHTIECCQTSQFEQHIRSILNLPLGDTSIKIPGIMLNLVGENKVEGDVVYENIEEIMKLPGVALHIYGKRKSRLNRKMGHITIANKNINDAIEISKEIKKIIKVTAK